MKPTSNSNPSGNLARSTFTSLPSAARLEPVIKSAARKALIGYPRLYRTCGASYSFVRFLPMFVKKAVRRLSLSERADDTLGNAQATLNWPVNVPKLDNTNQLLEWLELNGLHYQKGGHTIYIPPQDKLAQCFGNVVDFYPEGAGYKILKNFGLATHVDYIHGHRSVSVRRNLVGSLTERLLAANFLSMHNIGPRVWDLSNWHGSGNILSVFVVEHVSGPEAKAEDSAAFLEQLSRMTRARAIEVLQPNWERSFDFSLPSCNHNLLYSRLRDRFLYVDFQNFGIPNRKAVIKALCAERKEALHFGHGRFFRDQHYLYQSVSSVADGKRDTTRRWEFLQSHLAGYDISVKSRLVLDVGCNAGMILASALREGALWGFGWDLPSVTSNANDLLLMLGATRFTLIGAQLDESYRLEDDIPHRFAPYLDEAVVFYLSVSNQLGYLQSLYRIPWRVLVYEGHQNQSESDIANAAWANFGPDVELVLLTRNADGDSLPRPFALFLRKPAPHGHVRKKPGAVLPMR
jgi:hypothetical protein